MSDAMQAELQQLASEQNGGQATFDMANLRPDRTGLPYVVFISQKGGARHDVRIKLARAAKVRPSEMLTVAVRPAPRLIRGTMNREEFDLVKRWIELNQKCPNRLLERRHRIYRGRVGRHHAARSLVGSEGLWQS